MTKKRYLFPADYMADPSVHVFDGKLTQLPFIHTYQTREVIIDSPETDPQSGQHENHFTFEVDGIIIDACGPIKVTCEKHALQIIC